MPQFQKISYNECYFVVHSYDVSADEVATPVQKSVFFTLPSAVERRPMYRNGTIAPCNGLYKNT